MVYSEERKYTTANENLFLSCPTNHTQPIYSINAAEHLTPSDCSAGREHVVVRLLGDILVLQEEYNQGPQMNRSECFQTMQDVPMYVQL